MKTETGSVWEEVRGMGGGRGGGRGCEGRVTSRSDLLSFTCHREIFFYHIPYNIIIKRIHDHYRERRNQKGRKPQNIPTARRCHRTFQLIAVLCGRLWFRRWCWG